MTKARIWTVFRYWYIVQVLKSNPNPTIMKTILLLVTLIFSAMAVSSCTNDEGETEFERLTPEEEQQMALKAEQENVN